jgi:hypothetical protein
MELQFESLFENYKYKWSLSLPCRGCGEVLEGEGVSTDTGLHLHCEPCGYCHRSVRDRRRIRLEVGRWPCKRPWDCQCLNNLDQEAVSQAITARVVKEMEQGAHYIHKDFEFIYFVSTSASCLDYDIIENHVDKWKPMDCQEQNGDDTYEYIVYKFITKLIRANKKNMGKNKIK